MTEQDIDKICQWVQNGAKLVLKTHYSGRRKLKIQRGPFGLITNRFICETHQLRELAARLMDSSTVH
jgi:hypothetical protein